LLPVAWSTRSVHALGGVYAPTAGGACAVAIDAYPAPGLGSESWFGLAAGLFRPENLVLAAVDVP